MLKGYKYRLYPTKDQEILINKHIGACRFIYNLALETKQMAYIGNKIKLTCFDLMNQLPDIKKECKWLNEVNAQSLQCSITNLDRAFTQFFKGQSKYPNFKKKSSKQSFIVSQYLRIENNKLLIPKFKKDGGIEIILHRELIGEIKQVIITKTPTNKYFASILVETNEEIPILKEIQEQTSIGIDLGIKTFLVTSNGEEFENPKFLKKSLSKLKFIQSKRDKYKGKRTKLKLAKLHEKIANQRNDFLHKTSSKLISENQTICIEDLNIKGMLKNHNLAQAITDVSWSELIRQLNYKAEWQGKNILQIGRFEPSSKTCSSCGKIKKDLTLADRNWMCNCGVTHDRDINAAINIKNFALRNYVSRTDTKTQNELPTLVGVMTSDTQHLSSSLRPDYRN